MALIPSQSFALSIIFVVVITIIMWTMVVSLLDEEGRIEQFLNDSNSTWWQIIDTSLSSKPGQLLYIQPVNLDEGHIHSCYQYKAVNDRGRIVAMDTFCYPVVVITGVRKCSTSAMFNLFSSFPKIKRSVQKENCPFIGDRSLIQYFESLPRNVEANEIIVDGCVDLKGNLRMRELLRFPNTFFVLLVRDFADWLWSAYNYWCNPLYDVHGCSLELRWVNADYHFRTPSIFHDIVQGSINGTAVPSPLRIKRPCDTAKDFYLKYLTQLFGSVSPDQVIVIASEQLEQQAGAVWSQLAAAIGMDPVHPRIEEFQSVRYNTQVQWGSKGEQNKITKSEYKPGLYFVSKFQPLLPSTRALLNSCWRDDCLLMSLLTGYRYAACRANGSDSTYPASPISVNQSAFIDSLKMNESAALQSHYQISLQRKQNNYLPFFLRNVKSCLDQFKDRVGRNTSPPFMKVGSISLEKHSKNLFVSLPNSILVLSLSSHDREYLRKIFQYSAHWSASLDFSDMISASAVSFEPHVCGGSSPLIVTASPTNVARVLLSDSTIYDVSGQIIKPAAARNSVYFYLTNNSMLTCMGNQLAFQRVLILMKDSMGLVWNRYKKNLGFSMGLKETDFIFLNWTHWESSAIDILKSLHSPKNDTVQEIGYHSDRSRFWSADSSALIDSIISPSNKKVIIIEDLFFSTSKVRLLYEVIKFIVKIDDDVTLQANVSLNSLLCAHIMTAHFMSMIRTVDVVNKANMDLAYASESLVCAVKVYYKESPLQLSTLSIPAALNSVCNMSALPSALCHVGMAGSSSADLSDLELFHSNGVSERFVRKCKLRYSKRTFLTEIHAHPVILLVRPGIESVNVRLLIEHSTGIYSGSMETNATLTDMLHGEGYCGQRLSVVQANPHDVTVKLARTGHAVVSLTNSGKKKCMKGMIRGFANAVLIVRDPFAHIWALLNDLKHAAQSIKQISHYQNGSLDSNLADNLPRVIGGIDVLQYATQYTPRKRGDGRQHSDAATLLQLAANYSEEDLLTSHAYHRLHYFYSRRGPQNVLILSYESLVDPIACHRLRSLETLLSFAHFEETYLERRQCAFQFLEASQCSEQLASMHRFFLREHRRETLCRIRERFDRVLQVGTFNFTRLYAHLTCQK